MLRRTSSVTSITAAIKHSRIELSLHSSKIMIYFSFLLVQTTTLSFNFQLCQIICTGRGSLVGSLSALYESDPRSTLASSTFTHGKKNLPLIRLGVRAPLGSPCCVLEQDPTKVLVIPRKRWLHPNMTEKLFGTLSIKPNHKSSDSRRAYCQLLVKEWALNTGKLSTGGLPRNSVVL